jgi:hypothetical protein
MLHALSTFDHWPKSRRFGSCAICLLLLGLSLMAGRIMATTVIAPDFPHLVNESDYIVRAVVKSVTVEQRVMASGKRMPFTQVELEVKQVIAGRPPEPLVLAVLGGLTGGRELSVSGAPKFAVGEESILFVQGNGKQIIPLSRMAHGHYPIIKEAASGREFVARSDGEPLRSVEEVSKPIHGTGGKAQTLAAAPVEGLAQALTPDEFVREIRANVSVPHLRE